MSIKIKTTNKELNNFKEEIQDILKDRKLYFAEKLNEIYKITIEE